MTDTAPGTAADHDRFVTFQSPLGGVMTDEVGAITGDLEVAVIEGKAKIRYVGAEDIYTVTGQPGEATADDLAQRLAEDPGLGDDGNPKAVTLPG